MCFKACYMYWQMLTSDGGEYTGSAKKMYTHSSRWYLCIVFEDELNYHYNMWYGVSSTDVATR